MPCHRCEKSARESFHSHHLIAHVITSTRESTTRAWINDVRMGQFGLIIENLSHILGARKVRADPKTCGLRPRLWLLPTPNGTAFELFSSNTGSFHAGLKFESRILSARDLWRHPHACAYWEHGGSALILSSVS